MRNMRKKIITPDYTTRDYKLCWKTKGTSHYGMCVLHNMTKAYAQHMLEWFSGENPAHDYWLEEQS